MSNFLRLESNLHIFGHIFLAVSIFLFRPTKARGTNVRQFPTRSKFQIRNILSCLGVISFYFPPLEVVHPVLKRLKIALKKRPLKKKKLQNYSPRLGTVIFEAFSLRKRNSKRYTTRQQFQKEKKLF